jgi:hypothetical protein
MRKLAVLLLPVFCAAAGSPQGIDSLIDMARAAPGEFAADAMIRIAALDSLEKPRRVRLLEEAFQRASESQEPYRRRAGITKVVGSAGFFNRAFDQDLDALTLRLRVVEALLPLDKDKARDLFLRIPPLQLPKLHCSDFLVYDVGRYYQVLGRVAAEAFTAKQVEKSEPFRLVLQQVGAISSPAQVIPAARLIVESKLKDPDFQALVAAYTGALAQISGDDRSFTYAHSTGPAILALVDQLKARKMSPLPLLESYRLYVVANLSAARCADDALMSNTAQSFGLADAAPVVIDDAVGYFNQGLRLPPLQLIQEAEVTPAKVEGAAEGLRSCEDTECQAIAKQYRDLVIQPNGLGYSTDDRKTPEWQSKLQDYLNALASWKSSSGIPEAQYFRNKCGIYTELLSVVARDEDRDAVIRALLLFVESSKFQAESRVQWFLPVNALLGRAALDPANTGKLMPELRQAHDPIIALYAQLDTVLPRTPDRIMPLL